MNLSACGNLLFIGIAAHVPGDDGNYPLLGTRSVSINAVLRSGQSIRALNPLGASIFGDPQVHNSL